MGQRPCSLEGVVKLLRNHDWLAGRSVFVSGHTGFKGTWLIHWLQMLGAEVHGFALDPRSEPDIFEVTGARGALSTDTRADVLDSSRLKVAVQDCSPDVVIHLAAQPLVRESYRDPLHTININVIGTANLLEAVRFTPSVQAALIVTTDKVYRNREWLHPYRENDELGGGDPYSASKACAELITDSYCKSYFSNSSSKSPFVMTARAGNVIGGGDWAEDRILPDCFRAAETSTPLSVRYPRATRPWQHVLDSLNGYLTLLKAALEEPAMNLPHRWNFGPPPEHAVPVGTIVDWVEHDLGIPLVRETPPTLDSIRYEAGRLTLDSSQARELLGWEPRWTSRDAVRKTVEWHQAWLSRANMAAYTRSQIEEFWQVMS